MTSHLVRVALPFLCFLPACADNPSMAGSDMANIGDLAGHGVPDLAVSLDGAALADLGLPDSSLAEDGGGCPPPPMFNFMCDPKVPTSCPGGFCVLGECIGGVIDPHQYDGCGDGICGPCENAQSCPADCGRPPDFTGTKVYDDPNTITVWVHGFTNHTAAELMMTTYGSVSNAGDVAKAVATYGINAPNGSEMQYDTAPNQYVGVEYYGAVAPAWMSPQDVMEVEQYPYIGGATGLQRYGLVVAKFIKWRMAHTGATHVNIGCHSMGCLLTRYVIENDLEGLASSNKIVRWVSCAGVIAGAQLANLYNNPAIQMAADQIGLAVDDFALMEPSYVETYAASYDHKLWEGNNPLFAGVLIHHVGATDTQIPQALNVQLLNLNNAAQNPNDGIMYTFDEFFHSQSPAASVTTPSGEIISATHAYNHIGHIDAPSYEGFHAQLAAGLWHRRRAFITLESISLKKDHEFSLSTPLEQGVAPAEVVAETQVSYDPYTMPKYGTHTVIDDDELAYWSPTMFQQAEGTSLMPGQILYEAPVFDDQQSLQLQLTLTETDNYVRYQCQESLPGVSDKQLLSYVANVPLTEATIPISGDGADIQIKVHVVSMY